MKKLLILIAVLMVGLSSCGTGDIEQAAKEQLKATMREAANRPDDATLVNVHTAYKSDTLCILQFTFNGKNALGMELSLPMEYIYMDADIDGKRVKFETYSYLKRLIPIEDSMTDDEREIAKALQDRGYDYVYLVQHKVAEIKEKYREQLLKDAPYTDKDPNLEDRLMFSAAWVRLLANGREVPTDKGKDIKL